MSTPDPVVPGADDVDFSDEALGERLRERRLASSMSLRALARAASTSPGFLSDLERGRVTASVGTLRKLASALGVSLPELFSEANVRGAKILRKADRPLLHVDGASAKYLLSQAPRRNLEVYQAEFAAGGSAGAAYVHGDSEEMLLVIAGSVVLELDGQEHAMSEGDSAEYRTSIPHSLHNRSGETAHILWIVSPATS